MCIHEPRRKSPVLVLFALLMSCGKMPNVVPAHAHRGDYKESTDMCVEEIGDALACRKAHRTRRQQRQQRTRPAELREAHDECLQRPEGHACSTAGILILADADLDDFDAYARALPYFERGCEADGGGHSCQGIVAIGLLKDLKNEHRAPSLPQACGQGHPRQGDPVCVEFAQFVPGRLRMHMMIRWCRAGSEPACDQLRGWYASGLALYRPLERAAIARLVAEPCPQSHCAAGLVAEADAMLGAHPIDRATLNRAGARYRQACEIEPVHCSRLVTHLGWIGRQELPIDELLQGCIAGDCQGLALVLRTPIAAHRAGGILTDMHFTDGCAVAFAARACDQGLASGCRPPIASPAATRP